MDGMRFVWAVHGHGTLSANIVARFKVPCACTLVQLDAVTSNGTVGTLILGTLADDNGYLTTFTFGATGVPTTADRGDFDGALNPDTAECPHLAAGTVVLLTVTHASMIGPDVALTFLEG